MPCVSLRSKLRSVTADLRLEDSGEIIMVKNWKREREKNHLECPASKTLA